MEREADEQGERTKYYGVRSRDEGYSEARFPVVQDSSQGLEGAKADDEANANAQCENITSVEV
jgi:hypothetical protein